MINEKKLKIDGLTVNEAISLVGPQDRNLEGLSICFNRSMVFRYPEIIVNDCDEWLLNQVKMVVDSLIELVKKNQEITRRDVIYAYRLVCKNEAPAWVDLQKKSIGKTRSGKIITPKTGGQYRLIEAIEKYDIVFAIGPAGTGKTYLAVIEAVGMLKRDEIKKIVLTRPAVEAGESLGFLPGDLKEKVDPYLTPLYDALHEMVSKEQIEKYMEKGIIEIAPLAYMRGRTLDDAFVILDEAQNTTVTQMKMFLTRLGNNSRMVITGDITQIDLHKSVRSGLIDSTDLLKEIEEIKIVHLTSDDVVRHPLVQKIIDCYALKGI